MSDALMKCPFPGMNPYIEALGRWPGFHFDFISHCMHQLNERLPSSYVATLGDRIELIDSRDLPGLSVGRVAPV